jgi:diguanylate cyclase (GGDEF)-like protein
VRAALGGPQRAAALLLGLGMLSFAAGNIAYAALIRLQVEPPVPSPADVGYLGFYPLACAGALVIMRRGRVLSGAIWLDGLLGAVGAATALAALMNPVLSALSGGAGELVVAGAYPVGDLLLIAMLAGSLAIHGPRDRATLSWLAAGLFCFTAADVIYALRLTSESYSIGTPLDALWSIGMTVMAFALWRPARPPAGRRDSAAVLVVPLVSTATAVGVLLWATGGPVPALTVALAVLTLALAAARTAVAFHELRRLADARRQARTDELTGLANRRALHEHAGREVEALLLVDLDGFKEINDALGHAAGDTVLQEVARRLLLRAGPTDLIARLGGDEFALVLAPGGDPDIVAQRLLERIGEPFEVAGITLRINASIGIAVGHELPALLRHADIAMYEAKRRRTGAERFAAEYDRDSRERLQAGQDLDRAFAEGEFVLHYQPKCDARTGAVAGVEALVRWQHPERGLLFPDAFLSLIEQRGLTSRLTGTVLAAAAAQARAWDAELPIAVNLAATDLLDDGLLTRIERLLATHELPAQALELEITEGMLLTDPAGATRTLAALRELGVAIAVDDYGTGYCSLAYLRDLPADQLKIDRSFVSDVLEHPRNAAIVRSTVELAHSLGLEVVAEGVEDGATLAALREMGCEWVQGYHFTRPLPPDAFAAWHRANGSGRIAPPWQVSLPNSAGSSRPARSRT